MKKWQKSLKKQIKKIKSAHKIIKTFINQTQKNYESMKQKLCKVFAVLMLVAVAAASIACNVTRKVTTESSYYQKGDTAITITTKTIETYDAQKH